MQKGHRMILEEVKNNLPNKIQTSRPILVCYHRTVAEWTSVAVVTS